jgi:hypothetical protein
MTEKFANGSLCTYRIRDNFVPMTPSQIADIATRHGMPESLVPAYAGDRAMAGRAIQSQLGAARRAGWLVQQYAASKGRLEYTIARIEKDESEVRTDFTHTSSLAWDAEVNGGRHIEGHHSVAQMMDDKYQELRGLVLAGDWTAHIIDYIKGPCRGVPFLESGGMYWVPPQGTRELEHLRAMLSDVGIGLVIGEIDAESHGDIVEVAQKGLGEQLADLQAEVDGIDDAPPTLDGSQPASTYRTRLERLKDLRATALAYDAALGINMGAVKDTLSHIEQKVRGLLTVRLSTTIHKDGTRETLARPTMAEQLAAFDALAAMGERGVLEALMDGRLAINGDVEDVARLCGPEPEPVPDAALAEALQEVELDPALAALLVAPTRNGSDLPTNW